MNNIHLLILILSTAAIIELANASGAVDVVWRQWKQKHGKKYADSGEEVKRRGIWQRRVDQVSQHNLRFDAGLESYKKGLNHFSDLSWDELKQLYLSSFDVGKMAKTNNHQEMLGPVVVDVLPDSVDWRKKGYVTSVKDQGQCGSCWAFSTIGTLEGQLANKTKQNATSLSAQQLVDCDDKNYGCDGGFPATALNYTQHYGIQSDESYPYTAEDGDCDYNKSAVVFQNSGLLFIEDAGEPRLQQMVANRGPVSVGIDVTEDFFAYSSGVYKTDQCDPQETNHGVVAVGYGVEDGKDYWLVKNSWGAMWGEQGYIKMARNNSNMCNIASYPSIAII